MAGVERKIGMKTLAELRWAVRGELRERGFFPTPKTGTVTVDQNSKAVVGIGTYFSDEYQVGDEISIDGIVRTVRGIASATLLTVNKVFDSGAAHNNLPHFLVSRQGGWTDEDVDSAIVDALELLQNRLWREAPRALYGSIEADVEAGVDVVTLPSGLLAFEVGEHRQSASESYCKLSKIDVLHKDPSNAWPWWLISGNGAVQKPVGRPGRYTVVSPSQIELDTFPDVSVSEGLRFYGVLATSKLVADADAMTVPEADGFERVVVLWASFALLSQSDADSERAKFCNEKGNAAYKVASAPWMAGGREMGHESIVIVED
jgi:hypothetical protein